MALQETASVVIDNPGSGELVGLHNLIGEIDGVVQHPTHLYRIMHDHFGDSLFVARQGDTLCGFLLGLISQQDPTLAFLWQFGVHREYRGLGIGGNLVQVLMTWARARGATRLRATVETTNEPSLRLFARLGFENRAADLLPSEEIIADNGFVAGENYYFSGTHQVLFEYDLTDATRPTRGGKLHPYH